MSSARFWLEQDMEKLKRQLAQQSAVIAEQKEHADFLNLEANEQSELIEKLADALKWYAEFYKEPYAIQLIVDYNNWKENK